MNLRGVYEPKATEEQGRTADECNPERGQRQSNMARGTLDRQPNNVDKAHNTNGRRGLGRSAVLLLGDLPRCPNPMGNDGYGMPSLPRTYLLRGRPRSHRDH